MTSSAPTLLDLNSDTLGVIIQFAASVHVKILFELRATCHSLHLLVETHNCFVNWMLLKKQVMDLFQQQNIPVPIIAHILQDCFDVACKLGNPIFKQLMTNEGVVIEHCQNHAFRMAAEHGQLEVVQDLCLKSEVDIHDDLDYAILSVFRNKHKPVLQFLIHFSLQPNQKPYDFHSQSIMSCIVSFGTPAMFDIICDTHLRLGKSMDVDHRALFNVLCTYNGIPDLDQNKIIFAKYLYGTRSKPGLFKLSNDIINWHKNEFKYPQYPNPVLDLF